MGRFVTFPIELAEECGLLEAVIYTDIGHEEYVDQQYEERHERDGYYWAVWNKSELFRLYEKFATREEVAKALSNLYEKKMILIYIDRQRNDIWLSTGWEVKEKKTESVKKSKPSFVYFILNNERDKVKIGVSGNPKKRAKAMQTSIGDRLELIHSIEFPSRKMATKAERFLHSRFDKERVKNIDINETNEWFDSSILPTLMDEYGSSEQICELMGAKNV